MKTIFWNVDTQIDFMRADGKLYVQDAEMIEKNLERITQMAQKLNFQIVNTADWHNEETKEITKEPDFMTTFPEHCMANTKGAEYVDATKPNNPYLISWTDKNFDADKVKETKEIVLYKDAFNIFEGNKNTETVIKSINPDRAIVYGVATNVCVDFAVMGLLTRNVDVYVSLDAIKELPMLPLEETLNKWKDNGAKLIQTKDIANYIL